MTIQQCYALIAEECDETIRRLGGERRVEMALRLLLRDGSMQALNEAFAQRDVEAAFRAAHTLKGVALTLGMQRLSTASSELTECLRPRKWTADANALLHCLQWEYSRAYEAVSTWARMNEPKEATP